MDTKRVFLIETGSEKTVYDVEFQPGDTLVFGKETKGIPREIMDAFPGHILSIPFPGKVRSFNLANCVAMVMGEALRQFREHGVVDTPNL